MNEVHEQFMTMFLQPYFHTIFVPNNTCENKIKRHFHAMFTNTLIN